MHLGVVNNSIKFAVCNWINQKVQSVQYLERYWTNQADNRQEKEPYLI